MYQKHPFSAAFKNNSILYLVFMTAVCYIILHSMAIIFMIVYPENTKTVMSNVVAPQVSILDWAHFIRRPWTALIYFLGHVSFWNLLSNMIWLYVFGSLIQSLVGYREIIPLYIFCSVAAALVYLALTYAWPQAASPFYILGAQAGTMAMGVAALTLAPKYRYYLGERMAIPLWVVFGVFVLLNAAFFNSGTLLLLGAAAACGYGYMRMLQNDVRPGRWIYNRMNQLENRFTPEHERVTIPKNSGRKINTGNIQPRGNSQEYIDSLLDKINSKGYDALNKEEKEALMKASKDEMI